MLEKLDRQLLLRGQLRDLENGAAELAGNPEIDKGAEGVHAAFGKIHSLVIQ